MKQMDIYTDYLHLSPRYIQLTPKCGFYTPDCKPAVSLKLLLKPPLKRFIHERWDFRVFDCNSFLNIQLYKCNKLQPPSVLCKCFREYFVFCLFSSWTWSNKPVVWKLYWHHLLGEDLDSDSSCFGWTDKPQLYKTKQGKFAQMEASVDTWFLLTCLVHNVMVYWTVEKHIYE